MKILFILMVTISYGEREHAVSFARQLINTQFDPLFFIDPQLKNYFEEFGLRYYSGNNLFLLSEVIRTEAPALIIGCEYFLFPDELKLYLESLKIPLATMDATSLGESDDQNILRLQINFDEESVPADMVRIKPCPVEDPGESTGLNIYWKLYTSINTEKAKNIAREKYFFPTATKTVFFAIAPWAVKSTASLGLSKYYRYVFNLLTESLKASGFSCTLFIISPFTFSQHKIISEKVTVNFLNYLNFSDYENLLLSSDLVISDNIIQNSLSKAFFAGINTLALVNSNDNSGIEFEPGKKAFYKFNIFPLTNLFPEHKQYYRQIIKAEVFQFDDVAEKIKFLLADKLKKETEYIRAVSELPEAPEVLEQILNLSRY